MTAELNNLFTTLAGKALDPAVGIRVARLSGEDAFCFFGCSATHLTTDRTVLGASR